MISSSSVFCALVLAAGLPLHAARLQAVRVRGHRNRANTTDGRGVREGGHPARDLPCPLPTPRPALRGTRGEAGAGPAEELSALLSRHPSESFKCQPGMGTQSVALEVTAS